MLSAFIGEKISQEEAAKRELSYRKNNVGCFIYENVPDRKEGKI